MSEFDDFSGVQDTNVVDNGFEKLDPLSTPEKEIVDDVVSSTQKEAFGNEEATAQSLNNDSPLVDLGFGQPVTSKEPEPHIPDTTETLVPQQPEPTPSPKISIPSKKTSSTECCDYLKNIDPRVIDLVYWRDPKKTGIVFGSLLVLLLSLALFSVLSVIAYLSLAVLTVTLTFVIYKKVLGAVQKSTDGHPFKQLLEYDVSLPEDKLHDVADSVMKNSTTAIKELRRLFLVEDLVDSLKFALLLWVLTYIGAWFNGMTLIILAVIGVFTIPKFYETYKVQIDQYLDLARTQIKNVIAQIKEKIPIGKKKKEE